MQVNIHEAKTRLSELLQLLDREEEIIIANRGTPVARLLPYREKEKRKIGLLKGQYKAPVDFDECNDEIAKLFGVEL